MEDPMPQDGAEIPKTIIKEEDDAATSFCNDYGEGDITDDKSELTAASALKMTPEELNSIFCHEVFGPLKTGHQCNICGRTFSYRYQLMVHARYHSLPNEENEEDNKEWNKQIEDIAIAAGGGSSSTKPHVCTTCGRGFSRKEHLSSHMNKHTGLSPHECHLCPKRFSRKDHLDSHLRAHDADFKCHVCLKVFSRKEHLVAHVQWHTGASPHRCHLCRKTFTRREHLLAHVRQHTGESPHVCRFCNKSFTRREHVVNHERGHTGETPFKCELCPKAFARRDHLVNHTRQHTGESPYRCVECSKTFSRREHLNNHMKTHAGGAALKCHLCSKTFVRQDLLNKHVKTHGVPASPEEPSTDDLITGDSNGYQPPDVVEFTPLLQSSPEQFTCYICSKTYTDKSDLEFHMGNHNYGY